MTPAISTWLAGNRDVYLGNATATRDFRVQMRGNRSVLLFGLYLLVLIGIALYVYSNSRGVSLSDAQNHLRSFYQTSMGLLGLTVCLVAPALTATTIVMERQRQSIDLIFSAPVTPKYYLVGKMISSFRYTWMLLVLALPIAAASVVLGGASWIDVLVSYLLLSLQGLILTAFALLMSTVAPKPVSAIIWSYAGAIVYSYLSLAVGVVGGEALRFGQGAGGEAPFYIALSPWTASVAARTYTTIGTHQIPNWLIMLALTLLITKICLLGAGSLLSSTGGKEIVGLRLYGLLYTIGAAVIGGWLLWPIVSPNSQVMGSQTISGSYLCGVFVAFSSVPMLFFVPFLACYGFDREKRFRPNGFCSPMKTLDGTPRGGLTFLVSMLACLFCGFAFGGWLNTRTTPSGDFWQMALFALAFWTFFWSIGRLASSFTPVLKTSRTTTLAAFLLFVVLPFPLLLAVTGPGLSPNSQSLWDSYILSPLVLGNGHDPGNAMVYSLILLTLSVLMLAYSENRTRRKLRTIRNYDEQPFQPEHLAGRSV